MIIQQIITDVQNRLKAEVPALRYIDEDWGQLEYGQPPVQWPCALIDVDGFHYQQLGELEQRGEGTVYIRIADLRLSNTSAQAPAYQKEKSAELFQLLADVYKALHGFTGGDYSAMIRQSLVRVRRNDTTREYRFVFRTAYRERSAPRPSAPVTKITIKPE